MVAKREIKKVELSIRSLYMALMIVVVLTSAVFGIFTYFASAEDVKASLDSYKEYNGTVDDLKYFPKSTGDTLALRVGICEQRLVVIVPKLEKHDSLLIEILSVQENYQKEILKRLDKLLE